MGTNSEALGHCSSFCVNESDQMKQYVSWALILYICFVFVQSLFFKFTGSEETVIIFTTIAAWMADIGLPQGFAQAFGEHGGVTIGTIELIASFLLLLPITRIWGAFIAFGIITGAIFFHLFTPLGVVRVIDSTGATDGGVLFYMVCGVWVSAVALIVVYFSGKKPDLID